MKFADAGCIFGKVFVTINFNKNFEIFSENFFFTKYFLYHSTLGPETCATGACCLQARTQKIQGEGLSLILRGSTLILVHLKHSRSGLICNLPLDFNKTFYFVQSASQPSLKLNYFSFIGLSRIRPNILILCMVKCLLPFFAMDFNQGHHPVTLGATW